MQYHLRKVNYLSSTSGCRVAIRTTPTSRPAMMVCPPASNRARRPEASRIISKTAGTSVELWEKKLGEQLIWADSGEKTCRPSTTCRSAVTGKEERRSRRDVPCGSLVTAFRAFGAAPVVGEALSNCQRGETWIIRGRGTIPFRSAL